MTAAKTADDFPKCPQCRAGMVLTRSGNQRVCTKCDHAEDVPGAPKPDWKVAETPPAAAATPAPAPARKKPAKGTGATSAAGDRGVPTPPAPAPAPPAPIAAPPIPAPTPAPTPAALPAIAGKRGADYDREANVEIARMKRVVGHAERFASKHPAARDAMASLIATCTAVADALGAKPTTNGATDKAVKAAATAARTGADANGIAHAVAAATGALAIGSRVRLNAKAPANYRKLATVAELGKLVVRSLDGKKRVAVQAGDGGPKFVIDVSHLEAMS